MINVGRPPVPFNLQISQSHENHITITIMMMYKYSYIYVENMRQPMGVIAEHTKYLYAGKPLWCIKSIKGQLYFHNDILTNILNILNVRALLPDTKAVVYHQFKHLPKELRLEILMHVDDTTPSQMIRNIEELFRKEYHNQFNDFVKIFKQSSECHPYTNEFRIINNKFRKDIANERIVRMYFIALRKGVLTKDEYVYINNEKYSTYIVADIFRLYRGPEDVVLVSTELDIPRKLPVSKFDLTATRQCYLIGEFQRPKYRGYAFITVMRWNLWNVFCTLYVIIACGLRIGSGASPISILLRLEMAVVYFGNCYLSLQYHCGDLVWGSQYRTQRHLKQQTDEEHVFLKLDLSFLAALMQAVSLVWADNYGWSGPLMWLVGPVHLACVVVAFAIVWFQDMRSPGYTDSPAVIMIRFIFAFQFLTLTPYCLLAYGGADSIAVGIGYSIAIVLYVAQWPSSMTFGYHEWFHYICVSCHTLSMLFDLAVAFKA